MDEATRWDEAADAIDAGPRHAPDDIYFGPWAPGARELGILGPLDGRRVLDLGCGGGENVVALAKVGARVTGLDISAQQIARARRLAGDYGVAARLCQGDMHDPEVWQGLQQANCPEAANDSGDAARWGYDLILASYVLPYSTRPGEALALCRNALAPGGMLVAAMDHPLRSCFWEDEQAELVGYPVRDYYRSGALGWRINDRAVDYFARTIGEWVALLGRVGLAVAQLVEPRPTPEMVEAYWPADSALAPLAHIPHTLILVAQESNQG